MSGEILLKIYVPSKKILEKKVEKVSIPAAGGDLTVLIGRAPSEILLKSGSVRILGKNAEISEEYQIGPGIADIAGNVCNIYTESVQ